MHWADEPIRGAQFGQCLLFQRLLAGKVHEAWKRFGNQFQADLAIRNKYLERLEERCGDAKGKINNYFGKTNMITELRNSLAFHYPSSEVLEQSFQSLSAESPWRWFVPDGQEPANIFFHASEVAAAVATFRTTNLDALHAANEQVFNEVLDISKLVNKVIGTAMALIHEEHFSDIARGPVFELADLPPTDAVRLPFFTAKPDRMKKR